MLGNEPLGDDASPELAHTDWARSYPGLLFEEDHPGVQDPTGRFCQRATLRDGLEVCDGPKQPVGITAPANGEGLAEVFGPWPRRPPCGESREANAGKG